MQYLLVKAISLTLVAVACVLVMTVAGGRHCRYRACRSRDTAAVAYARLPRSWSRRTRAHRQRLPHRGPVFLLPLSAPLVHTIGGIESWLWYPLPNARLAAAASGRVRARPAAQIAYTIAILVVAIALVLRSSLRSFRASRCDCGGG